MKANNVRDGYKAVSYTVDENKSLGDGDYETAVRKLVNSETVSVPVTGSGAVVYECDACGTRHVKSALEDLTSANTNLHCEECGRWTRENHVVAVKED